MDAEDRKLVAGARAGERPAFVSLVDRYRGRVYSLAASVVRDHERALAVTKKTFVKAHGDLPELADPERFPSWLAATTLALARETSERVGAVDRASLEHTSADPEAGEQPLLRALLGVMPERVRAALDLRYREGLSYGEIAELLDEKPDEVRELLAR
ncbi:sigma-70 family RNA polymerase sigma factor, partial [bacterium]|nr:sigma-70 family RNA polymerase sigma factor [bacterium]